MNLLRIDHRIVNLGRLAVIYENEGEPKTVTISVGDDRVGLDGGLSRAFMGYVQATYGVRRLDAATPGYSRAEVEPAPQGPEP